MADSESRWTRTATAIPRGYNEHHSAPSLVSNRSFAPANLAGFFHPRTVNFRCSYRGSDNLYTGPLPDRTGAAPQWTAVRVLAEVVVGGLTGYAASHLWSAMNAGGRLGGFGVAGWFFAYPLGSAVGVWAAGNAGEERGPLRAAVVGALAGATVAYLASSLRGARAQDPWDELGHVCVPSRPADLLSLRCLAPTVGAVILFNTAAGKGSRKTSRLGSIKLTGTLLSALPARLREARTRAARR